MTDEDREEIIRMIEDKLTDVYDYFIPEIESVRDDIIAITERLNDNK